MKINRTARRILSITAFAWAIPFALAGDVLSPETENERESASAVRKSFDVSVETPDGEVKLTGFVRDDVAKR